MELFLNIFWFAITITGVILWRTRWTREYRIRRHAPWREWTAFVCSMVLLFFVVSLTDDLHAELMLIEECSSSRRHAACVACVQHSSPPEAPATSLGWMRVPSGAGIPSLVLISSLFMPVSACVQPRLHCNRISGRAPPAAAL